MRRVIPVTIVVLLFSAASCGRKTPVNGTNPVYVEDLASVGLRKRMSYDKARVRLMKDGWKAVPDEASPASDRFPEISCGEGRDAVCASAFERGNERLALLLEPVDAGNDAWAVTGIHP